MKSLKQFDTQALLTSMAAASLLMAGMLGFAVATEPQPYEGLASLCAVDPTSEGTVRKGNGVVIQNLPVELYRIETGSSLMDGWEVLTYSIKTTKSGQQFAWGTALLTPDDYAGTATLKDNFNILQEGSPMIAGTYEGTGDLEGVVIDYQLTPYAGDPAVLEEMCSQSHPYCETGENLCVPTAGLWGWSMSGVIYDNRAE